MENYFFKAAFIFSSITYIFTECPLCRLRSNMSKTAGAEFILFCLYITFIVFVFPMSVCVRDFVVDTVIYDALLTGVNAITACEGRCRPQLCEKPLVNTSAAQVILNGKITFLLIRMKN